MLAADGKVAGETNVTLTVSMGGFLRRSATANQARLISTNEAWTAATVLNIRLLLAGSSEPEPISASNRRPDEPPAVARFIKCLFSITSA